MERLKNRDRDRDTKRKDPFSYMLLILDDNGMKTRNLLNGGALDDVIFRSRHFKIYTIQLSQRYTQLSPTVRSQAKFIIFFSECNPLELRLIYNYHGFGDKKRFHEIME